MTDWVTVSAIETFNQTPRQFVDIGALHIAIVKLGKDFYAFESLCPHAMYELDDAPIENNAIICPLHGAKFCLKTGNVLCPPAYEGLRIFPVRIENGQLQIGIE